MMSEMQENRDYERFNRYLLRWLEEEKNSGAIELAFLKSLNRSLELAIINLEVNLGDENVK